MSVDVTEQSVDTTKKVDAKPAILSADLARRIGAEFIGTFVLVFTVVTTVLTQQPLAPLAIGAALMISIYAGGHISGAHFNPAVTIAVWVRGRLPIVEVAPYIVSQFLGAAAAAAVGVYVVNPASNNPGAFTDVRTILSALVAELVFTFVLAYVVLNVATSKDNDGNSFYGLAIGFTVVAGAFAVGGISGGAFNPAVALGVSLADLSAWSNLWVYFVAGPVAGALAGLTFKALNPADK